MIFRLGNKYFPCRGRSASSIFTTGPIITKFHSGFKSGDISQAGLDVHSLVDHPDKTDPRRRDIFLVRHLLVDIAEPGKMLLIDT